MKFCVENDLSLFEFHDSEFSFASFDGKDLIVYASMVNIHKNTPQNPSDYDMEIAFAQITLPVTENPPMHLHRGIFLRKKRGRKEVPKGCGSRLPRSFVRVYDIVII